MPSEGWHYYLMDSYGVTNRFSFFMWPNVLITFHTHEKAAYITLTENVVLIVCTVKFMKQEPLVVIPTAVLNLFLINLLKLNKMSANRELFFRQCAVTSRMKMKTNGPRNKIILLLSIGDSVLIPLLLFSYWLGLQSVETVMHHFLRGTFLWRWKDGSRVERSQVEASVASLLHVSACA